MRHLLAIACAVALSGCASVRPLGDPENYKPCAAADIATSGVAFASGVATEGNPLVRAATVKALGPVLGPVGAIAGLAYLTYRAIKTIDVPAVTAVNTVGTCAVATNNLAVILGARL